MKQLALVFSLLFFVSVSLAQTPPSAYTPRYQFSEWSAGANPGATGLNNNWLKIDTAIFQGVWGIHRVLDSTSATYTPIEFLLVNDSAKLWYNRTILGDRFTGMLRARSLGRAETDIRTGFEMVSKGNDSVLVGAYAQGDGSFRITGRRLTGTASADFISSWYDSTVFYPSATRRVWVNGSGLHTLDSINIGGVRFSSLSSNSDGELIYRSSYLTNPTTTFHQGSGTFVIGDSAVQLQIGSTGKGNLAFRTSSDGYLTLDATPSASNYTLWFPYRNGDSIATKQMFKSMAYVDSTTYHGSGSITTTGDLVSGSIASGFGSITTLNAITGGQLIGLATQAQLLTKYNSTVYTSFETDASGELTVTSNGGIANPVTTFNQGTGGSFYVAGGNVDIVAGTTGEGYYQMRSAGGGYTALKTTSSASSFTATFQAASGTVAFTTDKPATAVYSDSTAHVDWAKIGNVPAYLVAANNLSDLVNAATARTNIGLGSASDVSFRSITVTEDITDANIASATNWNTAYTDRLKWDGGATGLVAATGRTSLGLGTVATQDGYATSAIGNQTLQGWYVATSSGGSPTKQLSYRTITINGLQIGFLTFEDP